MTLETLTAFFAWMTLINLVLFVLSSLLSILLADVGTRIHARLFGLEQGRAKEIWYAFLGNWKIAIIMLNLVPYLALRFGL